jgi:hypothetical protein
LIVSSFELCKGPYGKRAEALHFHGYGKKSEVSCRQAIQGTEVLGDWDLAAKQD